MEDIAVKGHLSDIGAHIADARIFHAAPDCLQLVRPHPNIELHIPDALLFSHTTYRPEDVSLFTSITSQPVIKVADHKDVAG